MRPLAYFAGRWTLDRQIDDRRGGILGRLEGVALWRADADGLRQEEEGLLHYGTAPPMRASRRYLWREEAGRLAVFFEDRRPFHTLPKEGEIAVHDCAPDTYRVSYTFDGAEAFETRWHVTGPRKDAVIVSHFQRR